MVSVRTMRVATVTGDSGATVAVGQAVQLAGVLGAMVAGGLATRVGYRRVRMGG